MGGVRPYLYYSHRAELNKRGEHSAGPAPLFSSRCALAADFPTNIHSRRLATRGREKER